MNESRAAYRYALALVGIAEESKKVDEVSRDVALIEKLLKESAEFRNFLKSPVVTSLKKRRALDAILTGRVGDLTLKFVFLLASKDREGLLPDIIRQFYKLRDERMGILNVVATSVAPLTKGQEGKLTAAIEGLTGKKVQMTFERDPALIGGFTAQYDDTVMDASVKHQLEILRERFATS